MMKPKPPSRGKMPAKAGFKSATKPDMKANSKAPRFGKGRAAVPAKPFAKGGAVDGIAKRGKTSTKMVKC